MAKTTCDITDFHNALRARDPLGIGFSEALNPLLDLVGGLLAWNPKERLTAADALKHYYFDSGENGDRTGTAVEQQMLDPGLDMNGKEEIVNEFTCPKCGRTFDNLQSCQVHARTRKHAKFCLYDRSNLPKCLNAHSMLPSHPTSGTSYHHNPPFCYELYVRLKLTMFLPYAPLKVTAIFRVGGALSKISILSTYMRTINSLVSLMGITRTLHPNTHHPPFTKE